MYIAVCKDVVQCYVFKHIIWFHFYESKFAFIKMKVYICTTIRPW